MRKKFVYSCSVKNLCFRIGQTPGKHFLPPAGCGSVFPAKSFQDAWKSDSWLTRGQVNMMDEAKHHNPVHSTSEALVVQHVVRSCHGEELGSFCWPMPAACIAVFGATHLFPGRTDAEAPILWPPDAMNQLIRKDPDVGKDWRQEEKGTTEDEMVWWHPPNQWA